MLAQLQHQLAQRAQAGLLRQRRVLYGAQQPLMQLDGQSLLGFASNDYLGLAHHPKLIQAMQQASAQAGVGAGASHLINGHHQMHHDYEQAMAHFLGFERGLLFSTGYMANLGIVQALLDRQDAVFADKLNHACLNDAALLSRAELRRYPHQDLQALDKVLGTSQARRKLVAVDAVFSMDGDMVDLPRLLEICQRHDAYLLLDDAHGFGVLGEQGRGILSHFKLHSPRIIYMATLGKAAGVSGAFVAADPTIVDYLVQFAHTYVYTTATPPALAAALMASLEVMQQAPERQQHLHQLIAYLKQQLKLKRWQLMPSDTAIQPLLVGDNATVLALSDYLRQAGIFVPAIRPPTVPENTARLRISLSAAHSQAQVDQLIEAIQQAEQVI
jgi:8-amino-7-oxononanoate synthase